ncbi:MAG: dTDP-4-dehydrorhamnose reductase [Verrucomicrobiota bacterium]|jgi:dTDP-4-dehydrorhamnose reductase
MRILILGAGGRLGAALTREYGKKFDVTAFTHSQIDFANFDELAEIVSRIDFDLLINCAALTNVDLCEEQPDQAFRVNAGAPGLLAEICSQKKAKLIHFSTDYVFDGEKRQPYTEEDAARPISTYGESKKEGEQNVFALQDRHLVVRVSWVFGPDRASFVDAMIQRARENDHVDAIADKFSTPTYTSDIAEMLPRFFDVDGPGEVLHFANSGECSWQEYAQHALDCCQASGISLKARTVKPLALTDMKSWVARRPVYSVLSTAKYAKLTGASPRSWRDAVADYIERSYLKK